SCQSEICTDRAQFYVGSLCFGLTILVELGLRGSHLQYGLLERKRDLEEVYQLKFRRGGYLRSALCCRKRHWGQINGRNHTVVWLVGRAFDDHERTYPGADDPVGGRAEYSFAQILRLSWSNDK